MTRQNFSPFRYVCPSIEGHQTLTFCLVCLLSFGLNQTSYLNGQEPTDPDLLALHNQTESHFKSDEEILMRHRQELLQNYIGIDPSTGGIAVNVNKIPINSTTTKIVESIYWLHTGGDILQSELSPI